MALDPNIILQAGNFKTPDYAQTMELRSQLQMRNAAIARAQREEQMAQAKMVRLGQIGTQAATGDYAGARSAALQGGDFDVLEHIKGLEGDKRDLVKRRAEAAAPVLYTARKLPYEQRKAYIAQAADSLTANGWTPDEIAGFDPTDGAIGSMVAQAQSISDIFGREEKAADRAQRAEDNAASRDFARGNAYISAGLLPPGGATAPAIPGGDLVARMLPITVQSESGGDPNAVSPKGARGVMQVMPSTNLDPGFGVKPAADASEAERTRVGQDYLGALVQKYNDPAQAWAAYNAGPGRVDAAIKNGGANWLAMLPKETRDYVKKNVTQLGSGAAAATPGGLTPIPGGKLDKPKAAKMTAEEVAAEGLDPKLTYYRNADGIPQAVSGQNNKSSLKPPPAVAMKAYIGNRSSIGKIDAALSAVAAKPDAVGFTKGLTPDWISARTDPDGVDARSKIADIGSLLIHDRSGAAVTIAETPRLKPFVPEVGDTPAQVKTKLTNLRAALAQENTDTEDVYSEEQGFKFPTFRASPGSRPKGTLTAKAPAANAGPKVGTVEDGYRFKGGDPKSQSSWEKVK